MKRKDSVSQKLEVGLAHFMLPAAAFAVANLVGNTALTLGNAYLNVLAIILIAAGIAYTYIIVRH